VSDHTPLLLDTGTPAFTGNNKPFKFELAWFHREGFDDRIIDIWRTTVKGRNSIQRWNNKLSALRRFLRGWAAKTNGDYKKKKQHFQDNICFLDTTAETRELTDEEQNKLAHSRDHLVKLLREEEIRYYQRAKARDTLLGDNNTRYFQLIANGRHRKKRIFALEDGNNKIEGLSNLKSYITNFYKGLFGDLDECQVTLDESRVDDIPQVSRRENELLTNDFTESEVREAIFSMKHNKAPGPDGFPVEFYQHFWEIIKVDLMQIFRDHREEICPFLA